MLRAEQGTRDSGRQPSKGKPWSCQQRMCPKLSPEGTKNGVFSEAMPLGEGGKVRPGPRRAGPENKVQGREEGVVPSGNSRDRGLSSPMPHFPHFFLLRQGQRGNTCGEAATYPDHVFYDPAGGHCVFFYQFCQVIESRRWGHSKKSKRSEH